MRLRILSTFAVAAIAVTGCTVPAARLTSGGGAPPPPPAAAPKGPVLFADEFSGTGLNLAKWQPNWLGSSNSSVTPPVNGAEASCYSPSQATVPGDGYLHLTAVARACTVNGHTYPYTSGLVETLNHFTFTNGHLEARVWLPGSGAALTDWPAVWTDGTGNWPATGESDIVEGLSGQACFHYHSPSGGPGKCIAGTFTGWHTYAEDVRNGTTTYYYDGRNVGSLPSVKAAHYVILNLGVASGATHPATMLVDYVRVTA